MERVEVQGLRQVWAVLRPAAEADYAVLSVHESDRSAYIHLTRAQATQLRDALSTFIEEGA